MFELNPLNHPDALWQHLIMVLGAVVIGYIIGFLSRKKVLSKLDTELQEVELELKKCRQQLSRRSEHEELEVRTAITTEADVVSDNLKLIEGIGPKIEQLLNQNGIMTFGQLCSTSPERISEILRSAGASFQIHDPSTWPRQAEVAEKGEWERLRNWQEQLNKGKE